MDINILSNISRNKYEHYKGIINDMCIESAKKGNVHLVLTKNELDAMEFPISEYNFKLIKIYLQEEKLIVCTNHIESRIEIFWIDQVIKDRIGSADISEKFPSINDEDVIKSLKCNDEDNRYRPLRLVDNGPLKLVLGNKFKDADKYVDKYADISQADNFREVYCEAINDNEIEIEDDSDDNIFDIIITADDALKIPNMKIFVKESLTKINHLTSSREIEREMYTLVSTLLKVEEVKPEKNYVIFGNVKLLNGFIERLNEFKTNWAKQLINELVSLINKRWSEEWFNYI
jgi:hypothetical protein